MSNYSTHDDTGTGGSSTALRFGLELLSTLTVALLCCCSRRKKHPKQNDNAPQPPPLNSSKQAAPSLGARTTTNVLPEAEEIKKTVAEGESTSTAAAETWTAITTLGISYHTLMFKHGLVVMAETHEVAGLEAKKLRILNREMAITTATPAKGAIKKTARLLNQLKLRPESKSVIVAKNTRRREEVYIATHIPETQQALYIYPWVSSKQKKLEVQPHNIRKFVTAGCMYGSTLLGVNSSGRFAELIKHDISFSKGEKITGIKDKGARGAPYEYANFQQFKLYLRLVQQLRDPEIKPVLHYHLPHYDYLLFGIRLYLNNKITQEALIKFFNLIITKKREHVETLQSICEDSKAEVDLIISSPFSNLFEGLDTETKQQCSADTLRDVFYKLSLSFDFAENDNDEKSVFNEAEFVENCLHKLTTNTFDGIQATQWCRFMQNCEGQNLETIEDLFKLSNAFVIFAAADGEAPYSTCSMLPASEKQIQLSYQKIEKTRKNKESKECTPPLQPILCLTTLDTSTCIRDSNSCNSQTLFYLDPTLNFEAAKALKEQELLRIAQMNLADKIGESAATCTH